MISLPGHTYKHTAWVTWNKVLDRQAKEGKKTHHQTPKMNQTEKKTHIFPKISVYAFTFLT